MRSIYVNISCLKENTDMLCESCPTLKGTVALDKVQRKLKIHSKKFENKLKEVVMEELQQNQGWKQGKKLSHKVYFYKSL